jgi:hypothetical protein
MGVLKAKTQAVEAAKAGLPKPANDDDALLVRIGIVQAARHGEVKAVAKFNADGMIVGTRFLKAEVRRQMDHPANDNSLIVAGYEIAEEFKIAMETLRRVPLPRSGGPREYASGWPEIVRSAAEAYASDTAAMPKIRPSRAEITHMDEALTWLSWVNDRERKIILAKAAGMSYGKLARAFRVHRGEMRLEHLSALLVIALNRLVKRMGRRII